jgi:hypothetical protein
MKEHGHTESSAAGRPYPPTLSWGVLQRKCACGGSPGLAAECSECQSKRLLGKPLQTKLYINEPGDGYEQEADRVAEQIMRIPDREKFIEPSQSSKLSLMQRRAVGIASGIADVPPIVHEVLASPGQPLDVTARAFFAPRFGHDFANVRVHADSIAAKSAAVINARAYTIGNDIVFGAGQYDSVTLDGRNLIAHELAHVGQQSIGPERRLQRADVEIDSVNVTVNFDHLNTVAEENLAEQIISLIDSWVGPGFGDSFRTDIDRLDSEARRWLLFAIQLLRDNKDLVDPSRIVERLIEFAPQALHSPPDELFVREALQISGWLEKAALSTLTTLKPKTERQIEKIVDPREASKGLDVAELQRRLVPALEHWLHRKDPMNWGQEETRSLSTFQSLGDILLTETRTFFSPYADTARSNIYTQTPPWKGARNIYDVGTKSITKAGLLNHLTNRAELVGRNTDPANPDFIDTNIFTDVSFNSKRESDKQALNEILEAMLKNKEIYDLVARLEQTTGEKWISDKIGPVIGLATRYDAATYRTACEGQWKQVDTLCHEIIHAMVHPSFEAFVVPFNQIIKEGFTEVLGIQLFNDHVVPKAQDDPEFKSMIEADVTGKPCPDPAKATIDYAAAGQGAEKIRQLVGDDHFRAAYFLGKPELAGLSPQS